ncbi:nitrogenase (molybdenum-iron) subunit alpha [Klebsiella variicola]|uniref:nitrogenase n=1 Tax=Klebsiella variicola TaxID=244366 RepID=A0A7H4MNG6_KLEVA|nr:nitrogenase (molybdenum-iron) subunit alpha [Klebsiella variicola]
MGQSKTWPISRTAPSAAASTRAPDGRNYYTGVSGVDSFGTLNFTSDFQERDIVFGGDKKLTKLIEEMELLFPLTKGITIQSECPVGLIGDDISAVANASSKALDKPVIPVRCEGFRGVSQSLGHHIANDVGARLGAEQSRRAAVCQHPV